MARLAIRAGVPGDRALVIDSIVQTYATSPYAKGVPRSIIASLVEPLLEHPQWSVSVACVPEEPDEIVGFAVHREGAVAWVQVKRQWRRKGVARALLHHLNILDEHGLGHGREVAAAFMVTRIDGPGSPQLADLAAQHRITIRHRPHLPLVARHELETAAAVLDALGDGST